MELNIDQTVQNTEIIVLQVMVRLYWSTGDIIGVALDMDKFCNVYFSRNGTWQDSGDPTSGASRTGSAQNWTAAEGAYVPAVSGFNNSVIQCK